jgi:uncharacterized membrane protein
MQPNIKDLFAKLDQTILTSLLLLLVACTFLGGLIPPFQSPDEFDHIKRAYLLSKGKIILDHPVGKSSGGMIDSGLASYIDQYSVLGWKPSTKLSKDVVQSAEAIRWSGIKEYSSAPGTGFYFPAIYAPQAIGLALGEKLHLTVDESYRLARVFALATLVFVLLISFSIYPANPLVLAMLIVPMSLFQFSSAGLDGVSTALAIFSISAFLRIAADRASARPWLFYALCVSVSLLATSRVHLLPMVALVLLACSYIKRRESYWLFAFSLVAILAWLGVAIKTTVDLRIALGAPTKHIISHYVRHPHAFFDVLWATVASKENLDMYQVSFIGILGWLDTHLHFSEWEYTWMTNALALIGIFSVSFARIRAEWASRSLLIGTSLASVLLIFFALLVTWTVHPARSISGVQGRYFLVPMIMLGYALSGSAQLNGGVFRKVGLGFVAVLFAFVIVNTSRLLVERYYLAAEASPRTSFVASRVAAASSTRLASGAGS